MLNGINTTSLSQIYRGQTNQYSRILESIASGQRFSKPSDDFTAYMRTRSLQSGIRADENVNRNLIQAKELGTKASSFGNALFEGLSELKDLASAHTAAAGNTDDQAKIAAEFTAKANALSQLVTVNNNPTSLTVDLNSAETPGKLTVSLSGFTFTGLTATMTPGSGTAGTLDTLMTAAAGYTASADAFNATIDRQLTINENVIAAKENSIAAVRDIDQVKAIAQATALEVRQMASVAMMAQANISQQFVARLFQ